MKLAPLLIALALGLPGCLYVGARGSIGPSLRAEDLARIQPGVTTRAEMLALFGPPQEYLEPEIAAALGDDGLRLDRTLDVARRAEQAWTWQAERLELDGTFLLVFTGAWVHTHVELLVVFFDADGIVQHVAVTREPAEGEAQP